MIKEAFGKGLTNEEAIEAAKTELNAPWDADVQVELIKMAKKKTLGLFGGSLAEARAYYEIPDEVKPAPKKQEEPEKPQASSEEKPSAPEKSKTNTISVSAILGNVVASENSPSPTDAIVSKEEKDYEKLLEIEDVTHIEYLHAYWDETTYNDGKEFNVNPSIVGMKESRKYIDELNYKISDLKDNEVLIDEVYAEKNNLEIGDSLKIKFATLNKEFEYIIKGTVNSTYFTTSRNVIIVNYDYYIENISKIPMQVQLKVKDGADLEKIKDEVKDTMKELDLKIQTVDEYLTAQEESVAGIMSIFYVIIGLAVILSFIGIINNQVISFIQRRKEIAVLNSTCMSKGQLKKMLFFETLLANLIAAAIAIVTSILATDMIDNFMKGMAMYVQVEYSFKTALVFTGIIIAVLVFTLISPLRRLKKINIVNEIKYE